MVLAVNLADLGIGAAIGAIIAGAVAIILDQRRRNWEKRTRWQEDKRRLYTDFLEANLLVFQSAMTEAAMALVIEKLGNTHDEDLTWLEYVDKLMKEAEHFASRLKEMMSEGRLKEPIRQLNVIGSKRIREAASHLGELLHEIEEDLHAGRAAQALGLAEKYMEAHEQFASLARRDVGADG